MAPRPRSSHWLARRFSVTERTIRRDVDALQQTGVPIYAEVGRRGGYVIDRAHTLPPLNITAREAVAAAVALNALAGTPFGDAARSALCKLVSVMAPRDVEAAHELAGRVHLVDAEPTATVTGGQVLRAAEDALLRRVVLAIDYVDRFGVASTRVVEPLGLLGAGPQWYLVGWCRLRRDVREFRLDRMLAAAPTAEIAPERALGARAVALLDAPAARLSLLENADRTLS